MSTIVMTLQHIHATTPNLVGLHPTIANPFDGIVPNFTVFGAKFDALWKKVFAGFWAVCLIVAGARLLSSFVSMAQHRGGNHPAQLAESRADVIKAAQSFAAVVGFSIIVGIFFFVIS